ncbi:MAG: glycosyltransferase [Granulosicoccus sp.]
MKVLHVITNLHNGGAQEIMRQLISRTLHLEHHVVSLIDSGKLGDELRELQIPVHELRMVNGTPGISSILELYRIINLIKPEVVQTWLYHADLIGGVVAKAVGVRNIIWSVHHSNVRTMPVKTRYVVKILAWLTRFIPNKIICCSKATMLAHKQLGYQSDKLTLVLNGYDLERYSPAIINISDVIPNEIFSPGTVVFASIGRWHADKDIANLVKACSIIEQQQTLKFKCLLVGPQVDENNIELTDLINSSGIEHCVRALGWRGDIPRVLNAIDFFVLSSSSEAYPGVVAESMACGTPCVVTDVGDAAEMVSKFGWVVPPSDSFALAKAIKKASAEVATADWVKRKTACRSHAVKSFDQDVMVRGYLSAWSQASK